MPVYHYLFWFDSYIILFTSKQKWETNNKFHHKWLNIWTFSKKLSQTFFIPYQQSDNIQPEIIHFLRPKCQIWWKNILKKWRTWWSHSSTLVGRKIWSKSSNRNKERTLYWLKKLDKLFAAWRGNFSFGPNSTGKKKYK